MASGAIKKNYVADILNLITEESISTSGLGFDGTQKESSLNITLKNGYTPYIIAVRPNAYNSSNYLHFHGQPNSSTGKFYFIHNLTSNCVTVTVDVMWIPTP